MIDPAKPDLEESVNVTDAHDRVLRGAAAASREKQLRENGAEPMSLWVFALCAFPLLGAGLAIEQAGGLSSLFNYKAVVREDYVRKIPGSGDVGPPPPKPALDAYMAKGAKVFGKCMGCHGGDGRGDGANYPSLAGSDWAQGETERFAMIILNGLSGPTSHGKTYGSGMPAQGQGMSAEDLAAVMTYVRNSFGNKVGDVVTKKMAASALEISHARKNAGAQVTGAELDAEHKKALPGDPLDPATMLDPITLEPAEAP